MRPHRTVRGIHHLGRVALGLMVLGILFRPVHLILVPHRLCLTHGKLEHGDEVAQLAPLHRGIDAASDQGATQGRTLDDDRDRGPAPRTHERCEVVLRWREFSPAPEVEPPPAVLPPATLPGVAFRAAPPAVRERRYLLAPKQSPPSA